MRALTTIAALAWCASAAAADNCDGMVARIVGDLGATFERRTNLGNIHLTHPLTRNLVVDCTGMVGPPNLSISWNGAYPSARFYDLVGAAGGIVLGMPAALVSDLAKTCQRKALAAREEMSEVIASGLELDCQAFTRDGGGTSISIFHKRP